jgi:hypothetical protein
MNIIWKIKEVVLRDHNRLALVSYSKALRRCVSSQRQQSQEITRNKRFLKIVSLHFAQINMRCELDDGIYLI